MVRFWWDTLVNLDQGEDLLFLSGKVWSHCIIFRQINNINAYESPKL